MTSRRIFARSSSGSALGPRPSNRNMSVCIGESPHEADHLSDLTLILSWSPEEAARYLETYKCYEQKPADALKERTESDFMSRITDCLTTVKSVNKTDSCTLLTTFGTLSDLASASREDLSLCPGFGPQKAKRLFDTLHEPFLKTKK